MLKDNIDNLIKNAMKNRETDALETYRLVKAAITMALTAEDAKEYTQATEDAILLKIAGRYKESIRQFDEAGRNDLADNERRQFAYLADYLPKEVSAEEIANEIDALIANGLEPVKPNMGKLIKAVKAKYPTADGKTVADMVMKKINN